MGTEIKNNLDGNIIILFISESTYCEHAINQKLKLYQKKMSNNEAMIKKSSILCSMFFSILLFVKTIDQIVQS